MDRNELTVIVAANIKGIMGQRGMTAPKLASAAKLNATAVYDILSGKSRNPRLDTVGKLAEALNVPVSLLFEERTDGELRHQIIEAVSRLTQEERVLLLQTAKAWGDRKLPD